MEGQQSILASRSNKLAIGRKLDDPDIIQMVINVFNEGLFLKVPNFDLFVIGTGDKEFGVNRVCINAVDIGLMAGECEYHLHLRANNKWIQIYDVDM